MTSYRQINDQVQADRQALIDHEVANGTRASFWTRHKPKVIGFLFGWFVKDAF